jgi:manganese transport protein
MKMITDKIRSVVRDTRPPGLTARDLFRYIGPGLLVTVGFIDPGNWASNIAAGSLFGYKLLWVVTLSTIMLVILQHNAAHLGIATGLCMSEAATAHMKPVLSRILLGSGVAAAVSTALAEILGASIALNMLFHIPHQIAAVGIVAVTMVLLLRNTYKRVETVIIGLVSLIGISFVYELVMVRVDWHVVLRSCVVPSVPDGSILIIMSVLGAVVMPHNLFLHSEIIQSRELHLGDDAMIRKQLRFEFLDTIVSMGIGWAINSAMIIVAAATFNAAGIRVELLEQAKAMLVPLLGGGASMVFAFALLCSGVSSSITAGIAGGSIVAGLFREPFDIRDIHSRAGVVVVFGIALVVLLFIRDTLQGLIVSQVILSIQLPLTIFLLIYLTSSKKVMGVHANKRSTNVILILIGIIVAALNIYLLLDIIVGLFG